MGLFILVASIGLWLLVSAFLWIGAYREDIRCGTDYARQERLAYVRALPWWRRGWILGPIIVLEIAAIVWYLN